MALGVAAAAAGGVDFDFLELDGGMHGPGEPGGIAFDLVKPFEGAEVFEIGQVGLEGGVGGRALAEGGPVADDQLLRPPGFPSGKNWGATASTLSRTVRFRRS